MYSFSIFPLAPSLYRYWVLSFADFLKFPYVMLVFLSMNLGLCCVYGVFVS
jgi:hypothetical protein